MAKRKVAAVVKIQIPAGKATPAPPVGTALGPHGVAIMDFCKQYNAATEAQTGTIVPVEITVFEDRTFTFVLKTPPTPVLLRQAAGLEKGSTTPGKATVGSVSEAQIEEIAKIKMPDLNAYDLEAAKQPGAGHRPQHGPHGQPLVVTTPRQRTTSPGAGWHRRRSAATHRGTIVERSESPAAGQRIRGSHDGEGKEVRRRRQAIRP